MPFLELRGLETNLPMKASKVLTGCQNVSEWFECFPRQKNNQNLGLKIT